MSLSNYSEISDGLAKWLNREGAASITDNIPDFIAIAQRRIHRECDLNAMEESTTLTIDSETVAKPTDLLRMKGMYIQESENSYPLTAASLQEVKRHNKRGRPYKFAIVGDNFVFPALDQNYTADLFYYKRLDILSSTNTTNWLSENEPEFLMYAAMVEACSFLKDDQRAQFWEARYQGVKESIELSESAMDKAPGTLRVRTNYGV